jgi:hypothetical protein
LGHSAEAQEGTDKSGATALEDNGSVTLNYELCLLNTRTTYIFRVTLGREPF